MQHWWFPENASSYGGSLDSLFYIILYVTGAVFLLVEVALIVFVIKYRARPERKATYVEGSVKAEVIWTAIPAVIVIALALGSAPLWSLLKNPERIPAGAEPIGITVKQFEWQFVMAGPDGQLNTADDIFRKDTLHVAVGRDYRIEMQARDVLHSFFVPAFRLKQDAVPGMTTTAWFRATRTGEFEIACAELCGVGHYRMPARLLVHSAEDYDRWQREQAPPPVDTSATGTNE